MKRLLCAFALALFGVPGWAATYQYTGPVYASVTDFTAPCDPTALCQNYSPSGRVTGQFTTAAPLGSLNDASILAQVTSYTFSDGIHTFSSSDSRTRAIIFRVTTDPSGQITAAHISLQQWADARTPHVANDWFGNLFISSAGTILARHNSRCELVSGFDDSCGVSNDPGSSSLAFAGASGTWVTAYDATPVPTLSEWGLILLSVLLGAMVGVFRSRQARLGGD